jgi:hypothetical protein
MNEYIIRNCPAYDSSIEEWNCLGSDACECKDGHCILKKIVGLCTEEIIFNDRWSESRAFAKEILELLEIEGSNEWQINR